MRRMPAKSFSRPDAVNIAHTVERCRVLGPGERFVLWVQGCPLRCSGCHNPQYQPFEDRQWLAVDELAQKILSVAGIEGITYVGGEPFAQAQALAKLSCKIRAVGFSVMTYSGFTYEELKQGCIAHADELLAETDLLLDGRYEQELLTDRPWRGSDNQRLIALSKRYAKEVETWNQPTGRQFEIHMGENGRLEVLGIPPIESAIAQARHPFINSNYWKV